MTAASSSKRRPADASPRGEASSRSSSASTSASASGRCSLSEARYPYLDDAAWAVLAEQRASMREVIGSERGGVEFDDGEIRWWTFAGGRINATLRYALEAVAGDWQVIPDNFLVKVRGDDR